MHLPTYNIKDTVNGVLYNLTVVFFPNHNNRKKVMTLGFMIVCLALSTLVASQNTCSTAQNTGIYYNPVCTDPLSPYCTDTTNGMQCSPCNPKKTSQAICDCPVNYACDGGFGSPTYGFCRKFTLDTKPCYSAIDCPLAVSSGTFTSFWSCISGLCRPCNQVIKYFCGISYFLTRFLDILRQWRNHLWRRLAQSTF